MGLALKGLTYGFSYNCQSLKKKNTLRGRKSSAYNFSDNISVNVESAFLLHINSQYLKYLRKTKTCIEFVTLEVGGCEVGG